MQTSHNSDSPKLPESIVSAEQAQPENVRQIDTSRIVRSVIILSVVGGILYAAASAASDWQAVAEALVEFPVHTLFVVAGLVVVGWLIRGLRFWYYLRESELTVPLGYAEIVFLAGFALTGTPGKMGEAVKGVFLKQDYGVPFTAVIGILVVERLMDLVGVLLLGGVSFLGFEEWRFAFAVCAVLVIAGGIMLCMERVYRPVLEKIAKISLLRWPAARMLDILVSGRKLMTPKVFVVGLVMSLVAWGLESLSLYLILEGLELKATLSEANFVYCLSTILGALSMLPGGIGGMEASMVALLAVVGIGYTSALPAVILIRACTLWFAVLAGLAMMCTLLWRARRRARRRRLTA